MKISKDRPEGIVHIIGNIARHSEICELKKGSEECRIHNVYGGKQSQNTDYDKADEIIDLFIEERANKSDHHTERYAEQCNIREESRAHI